MCGEELITLTGHNEAVNAVMLTPDGLRAVSASYDKTLRVWDLENGNCLATFYTEGGIVCCAIAPYGYTFITGDSGGQAYFLRLEEKA